MKKNNFKLILCFTLILIYSCKKSSSTSSSSSNTLGGRYKVLYQANCSTGNITPVNYYINFTTFDVNGVEHSSSFVPQPNTWYKSGTQSGNAWILKTGNDVSPYGGLDGPLGWSINVEQVGYSTPCQ